MEMENKENMVKPQDVKNPKVVNALEILAQNSTGENFNKLMRELVNSYVIVPSDVQTIGGKNISFPTVVGNEEGKVFQPVFTDMDNLKQGTKARLISAAEFVSVMAMVVKQHELTTKEPGDIEPISGIVVNPGTHNITIPVELLDQACHSLSKPMKIDEVQYEIIARCNFEQNVLPKLFHGERNEFLKSLASSKEEYLNRLFEQSYENKKVYKYSAADFKVTFEEAKLEYRMARIDMPGERNIVGTAPFVYTVLNTQDGSTYYFAFVNEAPNKEGAQKSIIEVTADRKAFKRGYMTREGHEKEAVLKLLAGDK